MREVAKWFGILWMVVVAAYGGVTGGMEAVEGKALILPATGGLGEVSLLTAVWYPGYLLYCWAMRRNNPGNPAPLAPQRNNL
jgi:hypothetical protein